MPVIGDGDHVFELDETGHGVLLNVEGRIR
jgi:hypothetical protein